MVSVVVMGVSGSGKSTVGAALAARVGATYVDADDLHPVDNVIAMASGVPLDDEDRAPWLTEVGSCLTRPPVVVACSALKRAYRDRLRALCPTTVFVHLDVAGEELAGRVADRPGHFMPASLLDSQLATLEPLADDEAGLVVDATRSVADVVDEATRWLGSATRLHGCAMSDGWLSDTQVSYDTDAAGYADEVRDLLERHTYLRASLGLFAALVDDAGGGPVVDVGCGPGHVTRHLHDLGVDAFGIDLSPEMVAIARRDHPGLRFEVGTMTDLDLADRSVAGVVASWSLIHVPDHAVPGVLSEFGRVVRPGGPVLIGFHVGDEVHHSSQGYDGRSISVDTHRRRPETVAGWLREAGFTIEAELLMRPDDDVPGAIVFARSPA